MKNICARPAIAHTTILKISLFSAPSTALAMGGEEYVEGILILALIFIAWLIASAISLFPKTKPRTAARYTAWAVRLSLPIAIALFILDHKFIDPYFRHLRHEQNELLEEESRHQFNNLCKKHIPQATQILQTVNTELPKHIFIDDPNDFSGLNINKNLAECVTKKLTPACSSMKLESIEWNWQNNLGPCKKGFIPNTKRCVLEYGRYELSEGKFRYVAIDQLASNYVVRVEKAIVFGSGLKQFNKYQITVETRGTRQTLAKTEILKNRITKPCPNPGNEVAQMLLRVFKQQ